MAKPPTQLTDLLRRSPDTAAAVQSLLDAGSLTGHARRTPAAVVAAIDAAIAQVAAYPPGWTGPDRADLAADHLAAAGLLSRAGERQRQTPAADAGVTAFVVRLESTPDTIRREA